MAAVATPTGQDDITAGALCTQWAHVFLSRCRFRLNNVPAKHMVPARWCQSSVLSADVSCLMCSSTDRDGDMLRTCCLTVSDH